MTLLRREQILASLDVVDEEVEVPGWGGSVKIRTLTKGEELKLRAEALTNGKVDPDTLELLTFIHCVVEPKFTADDVEALRAKSASAFNVVLTAIYRNAGLTQEVATRVALTFRDEP